MKLLVALLVVIAGLALCNGQNDTTMPTTTAEGPTSESTTTTTKTTTTTTKLTTSKAVDTLANITIPKNNDTYTCLKLQFDLEFKIKYQQKGNTNGTATIKFPAAYDFDGTCEKNLETVTIQFFQDWSLELGYTLDGSKYELNTATLMYTITDELFPNATDTGKSFTANKTDLKLFPGSVKNAYKCNAKTSVDLNSDATLEFTNYLGQPFYEKKNGDFDMATDCPADISGTSKLVPIIVGAALAFLVILVLIAYLIGRRRHRSGYQSV